MNSQHQISEADQRFVGFVTFYQICFGFGTFYAHDRPETARRNGLAAFLSISLLVGVRRERENIEEVINTLNRVGGGSI